MQIELSDEECRALARLASIEIRMERRYADAIERYGLPPGHARECEKLWSGILAKLAPRETVRDAAVKRRGGMG